MTARRKDRGLGATANGGSGGSFASHDRAASPPPLFGEDQGRQPLETDEGRRVAEILAEAKIDGLTIIEADEFSRSEPAGNVQLVSNEAVVNAYNTTVDVGDVLTLGERDEVERAVIARAEYAHNLARAEHLRTMRGTLSPDLDKLKEQEIRHLTASISEFETGPLAPGHLLIDQRDMENTYVDVPATPGRGRYASTIVRAGSAHQEPKFQVRQEVIDAPIDMHPETASEYRLEIEQWLTENYGQASWHPGTRTFDATKVSASFSEAPTRERCDEATENTMMREYGDYSQAVPTSQLQAYLESTEITPADEFTRARDFWANSADRGEVAVSIGDGHNLTIADWAAASAFANSGYDNMEAHEAFERSLKDDLETPTSAGRGNPPLAAAEAWKQFVNRGIITNREHLRRYANAIATDTTSGFSDDLKGTAKLLGERLAQGPLIWRRAPEVS